MDYAFSLVLGCCVLVPLNSPISQPVPLQVVSEPAGSIFCAQALFTHFESSCGDQKKFCYLLNQILSVFACNEFRSLLMCIACWFLQLISQQI